MVEVKDPLKQGLKLSGSKAYSFGKQEGWSERSIKTRIETDWPPPEVPPDDGWSERSIKTRIETYIYNIMLN